LIRPTVSGTFACPFGDVSSAGNVAGIIDEAVVYVAFDCEVVLDFDELLDEALDEALDVVVELVLDEVTENSSSDFDWFKAADTAAFSSRCTQSSRGGDEPTLLTFNE